MGADCFVLHVGALHMAEIICRQPRTASSQIAKLIGPTWGPPGSCRHQMGPMLAPWTLLSDVLLRITVSSQVIVVTNGKWIIRVYSNKRFDSNTYHFEGNNRERFYKTYRLCTSFSGPASLFSILVNIFAQCTFSVPDDMNIINEKCIKLSLWIIHIDIVGRVSH